MLYFNLVEAMNLRRSLVANPKVGGSLWGASSETGHNGWFF
jgi:hypothetical protein